ncbi:hypothetical protein [uncultured Psychromonas sp.]|uniref:hypothetical protein n=1 Tax=uncultured Psychromonas sp. TaxID=173974 RepID=UPI00263154B0|nr:hypothetical protein [uncultured Psychromonas sp.]
MTEWPEVVDNLIKIGLPAIVTGAVTIFGVKYNGKASQDKFLLEHKTKLLEKISDDVDEYFSALNMLYSKVAAIVKVMPHDIEEVVLSKAQINAIKERDKSLVNKWKNRQSSLSKLRLLGAKDSSKKLGLCADLETELRNMLFFDKDYPNYEQICEHRKSSRTHQRKYHESLAKFYEDIAS